KTGSLSRLSNGTPTCETPTVPIRRSTLSCLVCGIATPRPMPVEPSCSRFMIALTMLSCSVFFNCPLARRLSTISRMAASLVVATKFGSIAFRTTKSDSFIPQPPLNSPALTKHRVACERSGCRLELGAFGRVLSLRPGRPGFAHGWRAAMILALFLVLAQLLFEFVQNQIDCGAHVRMTFASHEIVFVFRRNDELHDLGGVFQVHR